MTDEGTPSARIVVADDSIVIRTLLRRQLEEHGHLVIDAVDGEDALRMIREHHPDIVLLDVEMPKLDGHGVLAALRADAITADIPVVFLTARTTTADVVEGLRLGAHDYLRKPFEPAELIARVSAAHRVKALQDQLRLRNAELDVMSRTDALTGLPNRRHLHDELLKAVSTSTRHDHPIGVLMIDVDHFKRVNDTLGHDAGDEVLRVIATRISAACRKEDTPGRWGGEEFLVIAPFSDHAGIAALAERIRVAVAERDVVLTDGRAVSITASIGAAVGAGHGELLVRNADAALYEAKHTGRDRVVIALQTDAPDSD